MATLTLPHFPMHLLPRLGEGGGGLCPTLRNVLVARSSFDQLLADVFGCPVWLPLMDAVPSVMNAMYVEKQALTRAKKRGLPAYWWQCIEAALDSAG